MNGHLVETKTWDRIVEKFGTHLGQSMDCLGGLFCVCVFCLMLNNMQIVLGCMRPETAMDSRFHKVEPSLGERATHEQPTARLGTIKNNPGLHDWTKNVHVLFA